MKNMFFFELLAIVVGHVAGYNIGEVSFRLTPPTAAEDSFFGFSVSSKVNEDNKLETLIGQPFSDSGGEIHHCIDNDCTRVSDPFSSPYSNQISNYYQKKRTLNCTIMEASDPYKAYANRKMKGYNVKGARIAR